MKANVPAGISVSATVTPASSRRRLGGVSASGSCTFGRWPKLGSGARVAVPLRLRDSATGWAAFFGDWPTSSTIWAACAMFCGSSAPILPTNQVLAREGGRPMLVTRRLRPQDPRQTFRLLGSDRSDLRQRAGDNRVDRQRERQLSCNRRRGFGEVGAHHRQRGGLTEWDVTGEKNSTARHPSE